MNSRWLWVALSAAFGIAGCSLLAPSDDELLGGGGKHATGGSSTGASAGTGGSGATGGGSGGTSSGGTAGAGGATGGSGGTAGTPSGGSGGSGGTVCTPSTTPAKARPRALLILLDRTASMAQNNKWTLATAAVNDLATDAQAAGVSVALEYMDIPTGLCDGTGYSTPAVAFAPLPGNATALAASMAQTNPTGVTNLEGAFNGAHSIVLGRLATNPDEQVVTAFITDVSPASGGGGCSTQLSVITGILSTIWPRSPTYLLGLVGSSGTLLASLALAGGTTGPIDATTSGAAIKAGLIRSLTPCRFEIPPGTVSFSLKTQNGDVALGKLADTTSCDDKSWFSVATSPSTAVMCPQVCDLLGDGSASVEVVLSCP